MIIESLSPVSLGKLLLGLSLTQDKFVVGLKKKKSFQKKKVVIDEIQLYMA